MPNRLATLTLGALFLLAPAAAHAAQQVVVDPATTTAYGGDPKLAGNSIVYWNELVADQDHRGFQILQGSPGKKPKVLVNQPAPTGNSSWSIPVFDASAERLAYRRTAYTVDPPVELVSDEYFTGKLGGPHSTELPTCQPDEFGRINEYFSLLLVEGDSVARTAECERDSPLAIVVTNYSGAFPEREIRDVDGSYDGHTLSGHFMGRLVTRGTGVFAGEQFVLQNLLTGEEVYEIGPPQTDAGGRDGLRSMDVQADGTAVVAFDPDSELRRSPCDYDLAWISVAEPTLHMLPDRACGFSIEIENDTILYTRTNTTGKFPVIEIVRTNIAGASPTVVARKIGFKGGGNDVSKFAVELDFDGTRFSYSDRNCWASLYMIENPASPKLTKFPRRLTCPVELVKPKKGKKLPKVHKTKGLPVKVKCSVGCSQGFDGITVKLGKLSASDDLYGEPGKVTTNYVELTDEIKAAIAKGSKKRAFRIRFKSDDLDGTSHRYKGAKLKYQAR